MVGLGMWTTLTVSNFFFFFTELCTKIFVPSFLYFTIEKSVFNIAKIMANFALRFYIDIAIANFTLGFTLVFTTNVKLILRDILHHNLQS